MATISTNTASTISAMAPAVMAILPQSSVGHERRGAPDLDDLHLGAGLVGLVIHVGPGGPHLSVDPHATDALVVGDALENHRLLAHERRSARPDLGRRAEMLASQGTQGQQQDHR